MFLMPQNITFYIARNGRKPFMEWFNELDTETSIIIHERLEKIKTGYFGDHKNLGDGVFELRIHVGAGYRIYFGKYNRNIILLLCGGNKRTQNKDIKKSKTYWENYKNDQNI